ncbi:hypothetical protein [Bacillus mobilis]|uniref:hypothetical protein n=1 Tax=Bacillus mobilis TaxID=2026190 RepID=UPI0013D09EDE|nr:hypothetical protein [Bacillus mobilis]NEK97874.1 hypothetical protein [Bacillus mobilis]
MTASMIYDKLTKTEYIVIEVSGGFSAPNNSIIGEKKLYITNSGRVLGYDSGGIFSSEQSWEYKKKIKVQISESDVLLSNHKKDPFTFHIAITHRQFYDLYKAVVEKNSWYIVGETATSTPCLISNDFENKHAEIFSSDIRIKDQKLVLMNCSFPNIYYYRISSYKKTDSIVELNGKFYNKSVGDLENIKLFIPFDNKINQFINLVVKSPNIFQDIGNTNLIYTAVTKGIIHRQFVMNQELVFALCNDDLVVMNEAKREVISQHPFKEYDCYYNSISKQILIMHKQRQMARFILSLDYNGLENQISKEFTKPNHRFISNFGDFTGTLLGKEYTNANIIMAINEGEIEFILADTLNSIGVVRLVNAQFIRDGKNIIFIHQGEIALIKTTNKFKLHNYIQFESIIEPLKMNICFTGHNEPFFLEQSTDAIILKRSLQKDFLHLYHEQIIDISVTNYGNESSSYSELTVTLNNQKQYKLNVYNERIKDIMSKAYYFKKEASLPQISSDQLFLSYSRQINNHILYHYFGQLFAMHEGLKEIQATTQDKELKNIQIINYLYYATQSQKKHLDKVSIYLPAMLEQVEKDILKEHGQGKVYQSFKSLQKNLMGITSQIHRSLHEMESSISAVSFALIPREDYEKNISKQIVNRGIVNGAAYGVAAMLFGPVALIGAAMTGINAYYSKKDHEMREQIRRENENQRLEFYTSKIQDSFEHFIQTLLPFYISEVNHAVFHTYKQVHALYEPIKNNEEVREHMLMKITQLYTFKNLPIDESVTMKKQKLIELANKNENDAEKHVNTFRLEVENYVP